MSLLRTFDIPLSWAEVIKRTVRESIADNVLGLAAQLAFYFVLALAPATVFLIALTSFLPGGVIDQMIQSLDQVAPPAVLEIIRGQLESIAEGRHTGLLTIGFAAALWSSSAAMVSIVHALDRAYDIEESRPWWRVRLTALGLTVALSIFILVAFALLMLGPTLAEWLADRVGFGPAFEWTWKIAQWPLIFVMVACGLGLVYYFGPDAEQEWEWITPGSVVATALWAIASFAFKIYVSNFSDYNETYGSLGGVIVLMLWFYLSGLAILVGAELNAEIEHASPHGKDEGERAPGEKKKIGYLARRAYEARLRLRPAAAAVPSGLASPPPVSAHAARQARPSQIMVGISALLVTLLSVVRRKRNVPE